MKVRNSFTLLELLVIVAIFGILLTLLIPSIVNARKKAELAVCTSNQSQIGKGIMGYTSSNGGILPYVAWKLGAKWPLYDSGDAGNGTNPILNGDLGGQGVSWTDLINPYLGGELETWDDMLGYLNQEDDPRALEVFGCPSDKWGQEQAGTAKLSYAANEVVLGTTNPNINKQTAINQIDNYGVTSVKAQVYQYNDHGGVGASTVRSYSPSIPGEMFLSKIPAPSGTFIVSDAPNNDQNSSHQGSTHGRHSLKILWKENGMMQAQLSIPEFDAPTNWDRENMGALKLHDNRFSYLMLDGSVKILNPMSTIGVGGSLQRPKGIWTRYEFD